MFPTFLRLVLARQRDPGVDRPTDQDELWALDASFSIQHASRGMRTGSTAADHWNEMSKLSMIACTMVAALCALGLSVGAALAESPGPQKVTFDKNGKPVATGECFLHGIF
jgi:hypothetical protein